MRNPENKYIVPAWPAPKNIHAYTTTRLHGFSHAPYDAFNLGDHVEDNPSAVAKNRELLKAELNLPNEINWLRQVHETRALLLPTTEINPIADACFTSAPNTICAILTADCVPILICNRDGTEVAAIHAGWRGLLAGVIEATIQQLKSPAKDLLAWIGPAIGPQHFQINETIREHYLLKSKLFAPAFRTQQNELFADLYQLTTITLNTQNVHAIYQTEFCTYQDQALFYSHRRDQGKTGRMATLIWFS